MRIAFKACQQYKFLICIGLSAMTALFLTTACTSTPKQSTPTFSQSAHPQVSDPQLSEAKIEKRLRQEYRRWQGTRHRLGGTGSRGIDCSGFVQAVYKGVFNLDLPRTTKAQVKQGRSVPFKKLRAGDLVFFQPPTYPRHVGIYLGGSEFVHASKNKGVTLSKIDQTYWGKYYWTARRILPAAQPH
jgi:cell wall-associated NlpC family hydrolase